MTDDDILKGIPENWFELIDQSEIDDEIIAVTDEIIQLASRRLGLEKPSQDDVTIAYMKKLKMSLTEVRHALRTVINLRSTTRLFVKHYGHLFPQDEKGNPILRPKEIAIVHGKTEEEVIEAIYNKREELEREGLLFDWPEITNETLH
jgi:hypothetical protein